MPYRFDTDQTTWGKSRVELFVDRADGLGYDRLGVGTDGYEVGLGLPDRYYRVWEKINGKWQPSKLKSVEKGRLFNALERFSEKRSNPK